MVGQRSAMIAPSFSPVILGMATSLTCKPCSTRAPRPRDEARMPTPASFAAATVSGQRQFRGDLADRAMAHAVGCAAALCFAFERIST
jgi:hypothetical protein